MNNNIISRNALLDDIQKTIEESGCVNHEGEMLDCIRYATAVDAVEVVRCKDCEAWQTKNAVSFLRDGAHVRCCPCGVLGRLMYDNDFCSRGERRANYE